MPAVFISYRRSDSQDITGRIFDRLVGHYGSKPVRIVRDVDSIPVGEDFRDVLRERIQECDVVLVIIGPSWTTIKDGKGNRRLEDATDTVRIEIEQALELKKKVIPVCVTHAAMPTEDDLPQPLKKLAFRNGVQVRPDPDFHTDISRLIGALDKLFKDKMVAEAKRPSTPPPIRPSPQPPEPLPVFEKNPRSSSEPRRDTPIPAHTPVPSHTPTSPFAPTPRSGDSSGRWAHPTALNVPAGGQHAHSGQPSQPSQPHVRPLAPTTPKFSGSFFASTAGVMLLVAGLAATCMCGGGYGIYLLAMLGSQSYANDLREDIKNHPAIAEHVGEISSIEQVFGAMGLPQAPDGDTSSLFKIKGSKGDAEIIAHSEYVYGESKMLGDTLRLPSGTTIPLGEESVK